MWIVFLGALVIGGCGQGTPASKTIVFYSPHGQYLERDVKTRFEAAHPGWTVEYLDMGGGQIFDKLNAEKSHPRASIWWGGSAGDFKRAEKAGLLEAYSPAWSANLPDNAKSPTGGWTATFLTPEIIMYNPRKIQAADVPRDWDGLADPKWKGKIAIRDVRQSSTMKTIFGALILREKLRSGSIETGFDFLKRLDANTVSYGGDPNAFYDLMDQGPAALAPWNLADAQNLKKNLGRPFDFVLPDETMVPVEPIAIIKGAPNPEGAKLFYDFVSSPEQLILMANERDRIPARNDLPREKLPEWMRGLKINEMKIDWGEFERNIEEWMARWDSEVKGKGKK